MPSDMGDRRQRAVGPRLRFRERALALIDDCTSRAATEAITRTLGPDGDWGTDDDVARVLLEVLLVPSADAVASTHTGARPPGRITRDASILDLADAIATGDLTTWRQLYTRATTDTAFRQQFLRATAMVDADAAESASLWRTLLARMPALARPNETPGNDADR